MRPDGLSTCKFRGAEHGATCFCRHPQIAVGQRSVSVKWSQCQSCDLVQIGDSVAPAPATKRWRLGDQVSSALAIIGITEDRVTKWIGQPCGCPERREKLNKLSEWAQSALESSADAAKASLQKLMS